ncbi:hypothetical protein ACLI1A_13385 [Flavobacterium sp. RHBU_3]|uniref:hypothetical protein n=1 Tax=Flavobacterium sp. RHBU_3 TaxID=3391184 RepID=UPI003984FCEB
MFSWFKKKQDAPKPKVDLAHLPALNEWVQFFQGNGFSLYSRWAGGVPGTESETIFLKSFPEVLQLERATFADWLHVGSTGVYLKQLTPTRGEGCSLLFVHFETCEATVLKTNITATNWRSGYHNGHPALYLGDEVFSL